MRILKHNFSIDIEKAKKRLKSYQVNKITWLKPGDVAYILDKCNSWIWYWINQNKIRSTVDQKRGTDAKIYRVINIKWVEEFLEEEIYNVK